MNADPITQEWRRLYTAMAQIKELAPWEWMTESDVFGVQHPDTGEIGFVSVMGQLGEHIAIAVYPGADAIYALWNFIELAERGEQVEPEQLFEIPQLQAVFEDREAITKKDREVHKALGLKFRGRQSWPQFRSYRPGFVPWYLEAEEAYFLTLALEQLADVAPRFEKDESLLFPEEDYAFLVRVPNVKGSQVTWRDEIIPVPPPEPKSLEIGVPQQTMRAISQLPKSRNKLEVDFFMMPHQIGERGERPRYAYNLLVVDASSGMILGTDLMMVETALDEMLGTIPARLLQMFVGFGALPSEVQVSSLRLSWLLKPVFDQVRIKLKPVQQLRNLEQVKQEMANFFM
jgi:hypothetical protein